MSAPGSITLHSSWRGFVSALLGALLLLALGLGTMLARSPHPINVVLTAVGAVATFIVLFDYPIAVRFDAVGVHRRMVLRESTLVWDRIDRFNRTSPNVRSGRSLPEGQRRLIRLKPGGLVAAIGRRKYLLVNQCESVGEHQALLGVVRAESEALADTISTPPADTPPTWLGRRQRWVRHDGEL